MRAVAKQRPRAAAVAPLTPGPGASTAHAPSTAGQARRHAPPSTGATTSGRQASVTVGSDVGSKAAERDGAGLPPLPPTRPPPLKQQIESYFSDEGLRQERHLVDLISESPGGWVDVAAVLDLKKVRQLRAKREDVLKCLQSSWLEIWRDPEGDDAAIRRPVNRPVPKAKAPQQQRAQPQPQRQKPSEQEAAATADPTLSDNSEGASHLLPGRMTGAVSDYDEETGAAAISCTQTEALFQRDITIDWRELERAGVAVTVGSLVSFRVAIGSDGQPYARELKLRVPEDGEETIQAAKAAVAAARRGRRKPVAPRATSSKAVVGQRCTGVVKSFHETVGVGFIECTQTFATFGRDVSVSAEECAGFAPGEAVSFVLSLDPDLGTPRAVELEAAEAPEPEDLAGSNDDALDQEDVPVDDGEQPQAIRQLPNRGTAAIVTKQPIVAKQVVKRKVQTAPEERRYSGIVKSFNPASSIGRIACDRMSKLVGVDGTELAGFDVGDAVSFRILADELGNRKAYELEAA